MPQSARLNQVLLVNLIKELYFNTSVFSNTCNTHGSLFYLTLEKYLLKCIHTLNYICMIARVEHALFLIAGDHTRRWFIFYMVFVSSGGVYIHVAGNIRQIWAQ